MQINMLRNNNNYLMVIFDLYMNIIYKSKLTFTFLLLLMVLLSIQLKDVSTTINNNNNIKSKYNNDNPFFDQITAMLYHVEHTKTCGSNLQTFNIDFEPLWNLKLKSQIKKAVGFTKIINYLINDENDEDDEQINRIDSTFLVSFNNLIFSNNDFDTFSKTPATTAKNVGKIVADANPVGIGGKSSNVQLGGSGVDSIDPFIVAYSTIIENSESSLENNDDNCIYIGLALKNELLYINESCSIVKRTTTNNNNRLNIIENNKQKIRNKKDDDALVNSYDDDELSQQCLNWYVNLNRAFEQAVKKMKNPLNETKLDRLLDTLLLDSNFKKSQFCGPFYDCENHIKLKNWMLIYSIPLFNENAKFRGAIMFKLNITNLDINQCDQNDDPVFSLTHKCKKDSQCVFKRSRGFKSGGYSCRCKYPTEGRQVISYNGADIEREYWLLKNMKSSLYNTTFSCRACKEAECCIGSNRIQNLTAFELNDLENLNYDDTYMSNNCKPNYNMAMRNSILVTQCIFIAITIIFAIIILQFRRTKVIQQSMWNLLEISLFGTALLYSTLIVQYFEPSEHICILQVWFRELGFTIVYGIINLRLYKILTEFQSRKAHCIQLKDKDILRTLSIVVASVLIYLTAWSLLDLEYAKDGYPLLSKITLSNGNQYKICKMRWWDYFVEAAEFLFVCVGLYFLYCTRMAPSEFNEKKLSATIILFEGIVSLVLYVIRHIIWYRVHPDILYLLYFVRCHLTVTLMVALIFVTKIYCLICPSSSQDYCRNPRLSTIDGVEISSDVSKFHYAAGTNGVTDIEPIDNNLYDMDRDEIRAELKRLYTQLHIQRIKSSKIDNPHIPSKRKGNRKNRRLSSAFQKPNFRDFESAAIKTPEESICSNDIGYGGHSLSPNPEEKETNVNNNNPTINSLGVLSSSNSSSPSILNFNNGSNQLHNFGGNGNCMNQESSDHYTIVKDSNDKLSTNQDSHQFTRVQFK